MRPNEIPSRLCGDCPKWAPGEIAYPYGRLGTCGSDGQHTARSDLCHLCRVRKPKKKTSVSNRKRPEDLSPLREMRKAGATLKEIGDRYGVRPKTIRTWLREY